VTACILVAGALLGCSSLGAPPVPWPTERPLGQPVEQPVEHRITRVAPAPHRDPWLGEDKLRHFAMSFAATAFAYAGARTAVEPGHARLAAGAAATAAGVTKEIHDARAGGRFSLRDLTWNIAGVALGLALVHRTR
jgi:uncharacterized protein YfiM (DUF2279 family)